MAGADGSNLIFYGSVCIEAHCALGGETRGFSDVSAQSGEEAVFAGYCGGLCAHIGRGI